MRGTQSNILYVANIEVGTITNTENSSVVLIAKASMKIHEGDQLFITYGAFSNSELIRFLFLFLFLF